jgi:23S rRNA (cytosine1962-C5)-methyltransferase
MGKTYGSFPFGYELLDAGGSLKLERWGDIVTIRPELQAYFPPARPLSSWRQTAHWEFIPEKQASLNGTWKKLKPGAPAQWPFATDGFSVYLETSGNKHLGLFPEQNINWRWLSTELGPEKKFLNLFAYTGASSLAARTAGADVTHVDSVRAMIAKASANAELSGITGIRWAVEDAMKFVQRELRRGNSYDCIQMDPPAYGLGAKGEKWKLENLLPEMLDSGCQLLNRGGTLIVSTYSPKLGTEELNAAITGVQAGISFETSELWLKSTSGKALFYGLIARIRKES